jgi:hypothetical protein
MTPFLLGVVAVETALLLVLVGYVFRLRWALARRAAPSADPAVETAVMAPLVVTATVPPPEPQPAPPPGDPQSGSAEYQRYVNADPDSMDAWWVD